MPSPQAAAVELMAGIIRSTDPASLARDMEREQLRTVVYEKDGAVAPSDDYQLYVPSGGQRIVPRLIWHVRNSSAGYRPRAVP